MDEFTIQILPNLTWKWDIVPLRNILWLEGVFSFPQSYLAFINMLLFWAAFTTTGSPLTLDRLS